MKMWQIAYFVAFLVLPTYTYSNECDPDFVAQRKAEIEKQKAYNECDLSVLKKSYRDSSQELVQILDLLETPYRKYLTDVCNDNPQSCKNVDNNIQTYIGNLNVANAKIKQGENIKQMTINGLACLRDWAKTIDPQVQIPMETINKFSKGLANSTDRITICKSNLQLKLSQKWGARLIECINISLAEAKSLSTTCNTNSAANGGSSPAASGGN
jgi:hypothetical protein